MNSIKQTLEAQGVKASIIRRNRKMWKLKQFNGSNASEHVTNYVENNKIGDFEVVGFIQNHSFGESILIKYWEDKNNE